MKMATAEEFTLYSISVAVLIFFFVLSLALFIKKVWNPFVSERRYLKMEIARSRSERERKHWKKELKYLYTSYIPIIRRIVLQKQKKR